MSNDTFGIAIPAYNEAEGIVEFVSEIQKEFGEAGLRTIFFVQDDCSTDGMVQALTSEGDIDQSRVLIESNTRNRGHGPTSRRALQRAIDDYRVSWILHVDGDGQYLGADLVSLAMHAMDSQIAVFGKRIGRTDPWFRKTLTKTLRVIVQLTIRERDIYDVNTPVRVMPKAQLKQVLPPIPEDTLIPSVWISIMTQKNFKLEWREIATWPRRGSSEVGTMWSSSKSIRLRRLIPTRRLVLFVVNASQELKTLLGNIKRFSVEAKKQAANE